MKRNLLWIEAARTVAMFVVLAWHSMRVAATADGQLAAWAHLPAVILTFAVPMFFMVSGYLAQKSRSTAELSRVEFTRRKLLSVYVPFMVWNVLYMVFFALMWGWPIWSGDTLWKLLTGYIHLWFVFVLFQFFMLHKLLIHRLRNGGAGVALVVAAAVSFCFYGVSSNVLLAQGDDHHFFEWYIGKIFVGWSVFYFLGVYFAAVPERLEQLSNRLLPLGALTLAAMLLSWNAISSEIAAYGNLVRHYFLLPSLPFQILAAVFSLAALMRLERHAVPGMGFLAAQGKDTFGIYLLHLAPLFLLIDAWKALGLTFGGLQSLAPAVLTWLIGAACVRICRRERFKIVGAILFGGR